MKRCEKCQEEVKILYHGECISCITKGDNDNGSG